MHEASMARLAATQALFEKPAAEVAGAAGQQRSLTDVFKPLLSWTEKQDKQWKEDLVCCVAEQYLPLAIVDAPAFRSMMQTLNPKASIPDRRASSGKCQKCELLWSRILV